MTTRSYVAIIGAFVLAGLLAGAALAGHKVIRGEAIYYSNQYSGDAMACGPIYRPRKMVAAHRRLPCGTKLRVKNLSNGKVVKVTVQDRGPFGDKDTVLDVSRRAAKRLGFISAGRTRIKAVVLHD